MSPASGSWISNADLVIYIVISNQFLSSKKASRQPIYLSNLHEQPQQQP